MANSHHFLSEPYLFISRFFGKLTLADLVEGTDVCRSSPLFRASMPQLIDLSQVSDISLDFDELRRFLALLRQDYSLNDHDIAMHILVAEPHNFAHAHQFELLAADLESLNVKIFTDTRECLTALGLDAASVDSLLADAVHATQSHSADTSD